LKEQVLTLKTQVSNEQMKCAELEASYRSLKQSTRPNAEMEGFFAPKTVSNATAAKELELNGEHSKQVAALNENLRRQEEVIREFSRDKVRLKEGIAGLEEERMVVVVKAKEEGMNEAYSSVQEFAASRISAVMGE
jgi:hypothetical protein